MRRFRLAHKCRHDLLKISQYTLAQWGRAQQKKYLSQLVKRFAALGDEPKTGKSCDEIKSGYFKYPEGKHVIFYRLGEDGLIEIVRVLHESMDYRLHLV